MFFWVFCVLPKPLCAALPRLQHTELELWGALVLNSFLFYIIVLCGSQGRGLVKSALGSCGQHEPGQQPLELMIAAVVAVSPLCLCHPCLCTVPLCPSVLGSRQSTESRGVLACSTGSWLFRLWYAQRHGGLPSTVEVFALFYMDSVCLL